MSSLPAFRLVGIYPDQSELVLWTGIRSLDEANDLARRLRAYHDFSEIHVELMDVMRAISAPTAPKVVTDPTGKRIGKRITLIAKSSGDSSATSPSSRGRVGRKPKESGRAES
jgi:hypothetical protein